MQTAARVGLIILGLFIVVLGIAIACVLDRDAGAFECPECGERFRGLHVALEWRL